MKKLNEGFFTLICLAFSALLLVLYLMTSADVTAEKDKRSALAREVQSLADENELLRARVEAQLSLAEIERRARQELGMQPCSPGQIEVLTIDK